MSLMNFRRPAAIHRRIPAILGFTCFSFSGRADGTPQMVETHCASKLDLRSKFRQWPGLELHLPGRLSPTVGRRRGGAEKSASVGDCTQARKRTQRSALVGNLTNE